MQINEEEFVDDIKRFVSENVSLSKISDEELAERIDQIVTDRLKDIYCPIETKVSISQQVYSSIRGFGLLDSIISDDSITEVMINGPEKIFIEKKGRLTRLDKKFESQRKLEDVIQRIVGLAGREVNQANPICDTRLPDGSRVNVVLPPIALCGPTITIRKFSKEPMTINKLIEYGSITQEIADKLELLVKAKYNIFISGGTGSGKTTFLNALSNFIPKDERIITIEDSAELQIAGIDNLVSLETRNANASGAGQITIRDLIKSSLRMRPERIIVGECRAGGNFENIRDNLYLSTYIMEMLSYSTIDNEGRYDILKDQGFDVSTLTKENMDDKYNSVNDKWNSDEYKDYFNKSLTNKRLCKENNAAYGCELEYILYGHENNNENINAAYGQIYEIRYVLNLISAFEHFWNKGSETGKAINAVGEAIMYATQGVIPKMAVKAVLIALLTVFETSNDLNRLEAGFSVELYKTKAAMWQISLDYGTNAQSGNTSISDILSIVETKFGNFANSCDNGLRYSDYLCIFIVCGMQSDIGESMTLRCADVIQANMRKITKDSGYKLENSKTYFELDSKLKVDPLLITLPLYSDYTDLYDSSSTDWCTYNIKTIRGY